MTKKNPVSPMSTGNAALSAGHATRLAKDDDYRVRRDLASAIRRNKSSIPPDQTADVLNILATDVRRSIRRLVSHLTAAR
jgi:hypothetical protein